MPKICSISIGKVRELLSQKQNNTLPIYSAIYKTPISTLNDLKMVEVDTLGIQGDEQSNLQVHGGIDKAIYAYASEHYEFWQTQLKLNHRLEDQNNLEHGFLGENLTIEGIREVEVFIGDNWHINDTILQVTQFREPCYKLNMRMNFQGAAKMMAQSGFSGWYLRVIQTGKIKAGDEIVVQPGTRQISIANQNTTFYRLKGQTNLDF
jgi:MOSC domain-containing protein YiiM